MTGGIKNSVLMIGPTGVSKLTSSSSSPPSWGAVHQGNATKFSGRGMGGDVGLVGPRARSGRRHRAGAVRIIYIDEIDKIASAKNLIGPTFPPPASAGAAQAMERPCRSEGSPRPGLDDAGDRRFRKTGKRRGRSKHQERLFIMSGAFCDRFRSSALIAGDRLRCSHHIAKEQIDI
jgi:hypothetical protein